MATYNLNSFENINTVTPLFSVDTRYFSAPDTFINTNVMGDFAINDNKLLHTFTNESLFGDLVSTHNSLLTNIGNNLNESTFGVPIVISRAYEISPPTSYATRNPFASISSSEIGLKKFKFRDLSTSFVSHPITGDLTTVTDFNAVAQSIKNIVLTNKTERHFSDINFGVGIEKYLFKLNTEIDSEIREDILRQVTMHEPRAIIRDINIDVYPDRHQMGISISYGIKTYDKTDNIKLFLERA